MAAINFVKGEQYYTAEFQINGPVNVHIERAEAGALYFRQRSIDHGSYDLINGANWNNRGDLTIDTAIQGVVYPMWIKIESASEPTLAEMVEGEQSGGGAGTADSGENIEYLDIRAVDNENTKATLVCSSLLYRADVPAEDSIPGGIMIMPIGFNLAQGENPQEEITKSLPYVEAVAISNTMPYVLLGGDYSLAGIMKIFGGINNAEEILSSLPRLSRAQFFSLDNLEA